MAPDDGGFEQISKSVFRVQTEWNGKCATGTGFVVGLIKGTRKLILATARHCLEFPSDTTVDWKVEQFDEHGNVARQCTFSTSQQLKGDVPYRTHNSFDVGLLVLPARSDAGDFLLAEAEKPVCVIDPRKGVSTGTRLQWTGFPGAVERALGFPQLCCFHGVVSAMVNRLDKRMYVVDGHGAQGVSGGPVWHWCQERDRLEVVGIVTEYRPIPNGLPGFCLFEPVNPVIRIRIDSYARSAPVR